MTELILIIQVTVGGWASIAAFVWLWRIVRRAAREATDD